MSRLRSSSKLLRSEWQAPYIHPVRGYGRYLYENLNPSDKRDDVEVIYSGDKSKARAVGRFAPRANPEYQFYPGESELTTLIATDVLAEGLNMQDCDKIVNYDLHWNPVRLIQSFGRIDRIGSEHGAIFGFNFLPETGIEENLGLGDTARAHKRDSDHHRRGCRHPGAWRAAELGSHVRHL